MLLPGENSPKTWLFLTILVSSIIAFCESSGKTLDIKIGFDLTQGSNGAPSLRIRDFEDSTEYNPRALDDASSSSESNTSGRKSSPRGQSSDSSERHPKKDESSKEPAKSPKSSGDSESEEVNNSGSGDSKRSTRGLKAIDFEPEEENPKIHGRYQKSGSDASNGS